MSNLFEDLLDNLCDLVDGDLDVLDMLFDDNNLLSVNWNLSMRSSLNDVNVVMDLLSVDMDFLGQLVDLLDVNSDNLVELVVNNSILLWMDTNHRWSGELSNSRFADTDWSVTLFLNFIVGSVMGLKLVANMIESVNLGNKVGDFGFFLVGVLTSEHWFQNSVMLDSDLMELDGSDMDDMSDLLNSLDQFMDCLFQNNDLLLVDSDLVDILANMDNSSDSVNLSSVDSDLLD